MKKIAYFLLALSLFFVSCKRDFSDSKMKITLPDSAITAIERNSSDSELLRVKINFTPLDNVEPRPEPIIRTQTIKKSAIKGSFIIKVTRVPINKQYNIDITISNSKGNIIWETSSKLYVEAGINNIEMLANTHEYAGSFNVLNYTEQRVNRDSQTQKIGGFEYYTHIITYINNSDNSIERRINKDQIVFEISDEYDYIPYITLQKKYGEDYIDPYISTQVFFDLSNNRFGVISNFNDEGSFRLQFTYGNSVTYKYFNAKKIFNTSITTSVYLYDKTSSDAKIHLAQPVSNQNCSYNYESDYSSGLTIPLNTIDFVFSDKTTNKIFCLYEDNKIKVINPSNTSNNFDINITSSHTYNKIYYDFSDNTLYLLSTTGDIYKITSSSFANEASCNTIEYEALAFTPDDYEIQDFVKSSGYVYVIAKNKVSSGKEKFKLLKVNIMATSGVNKASYFGSTNLFSDLYGINIDCPNYDDLTITDCLILKDDINEYLYLLGKTFGMKAETGKASFIYSNGFILKGSLTSSGTVYYEKYFSSKNNNNYEEIRDNIKYRPFSNSNPIPEIFYGPEKIVGFTNNRIFIADSGIVFNGQKTYKEVRQVLPLYLDSLILDTDIAKPKSTNYSYRYKVGGDINMYPFSDYYIPGVNLFQQFESSRTYTDNGISIEVNRN